MSSRALNDLFSSGSEAFYSGNASPQTEADTQAPTMSTMFNNAVDFIAKLPASSFGYEGAQYGYRSSTSYVGNSYVTRTETVYKPARLVYGTSGGTGEEDDITRAIDQVGRAATLCAAAAVATAIFFSLLKELR
ncbi:MAG: hypothetical protein JSR46_11245 [Verrucomicrobia bacterium]|nr:hypothetical protein [Verrucomicrobiota bacterium]